MKLQGVKIFETGNYLQGNFPTEKVESIFNNLDGSVKGQFAHSSKWENPEDAIEIGEFSNFKLDEGKILADIDFNEKGEEYYNDGIIKGVSVEIGEDNISKIAVLPLGVEPAINGAEFEEKGILEFGSKIFEDIKKKEEKKEFQFEEMMDEIKDLDMTEENENMLSPMVDLLFEKMDEKHYIGMLEKRGYKVTKEFQDEHKTIEEITKEVETRLIKKYDAEKKGKIEFDKFKAEGKITPAMEEAGINEDFFKVINFNENTTLEFEDKKNDISVVRKIFEVMPNIININPEKKEFNNQEEKTGIYNTIQKRINDIKKG